MEKELEAIYEVADELQRYTGVDDWLIRSVRDHSWQMFATNEQRDARREVHKEKLTCHIFHDLPLADGGPQLRGSASFTLVPSLSWREDARHMLDSSLLMAKAAGNPFYTLPLPPAQGYPAVQSCDADIVAHPRETLEELFNAITEAIRQEGQIVGSSTELFVTTSIIHFMNSRGIDVTAQKTSVALEVILIASDGKHQAQHSILTSRGSASDFRIEELLRRNAQFARDGLVARMPKTHKGRVIITHEALANLFTPFIYHSSAKTVYQSLSRLRVGEPISEAVAQASGTKLTLVSSRTLPFGNESLAFDAEGIPAMDTEIIRDGIVQRYWADSRYAQYVGVPVTGRFGNIVMGVGNEPYDALRADDPTYEIVAFSWLEPDPQTGDFVAEIQLGYVYAGGVKKPIKGGSLSGNVFSAFGNFSASSETQFSGKFSGPLSVRFEDLTISGE